MGSSSPRPAPTVTGKAGSGRRKAKVKIPPGVDSGTHLVMAGEGNGGGHGGPPGIYTSSSRCGPMSSFSGRVTTCASPRPSPSSGGPGDSPRRSHPQRHPRARHSAGHATRGDDPAERGKGCPPKGPAGATCLVEVRVVIPRDLNARQTALLLQLARRTRRSTHHTGGQAPGRRPLAQALEQRQELEYSEINRDAGLPCISGDLLTWWRSQVWLIQETVS